MNFFYPRIKCFFAIAILLLFAGRASAQLDSGNVFLKGSYVEVGIAPNGAFGTPKDAPAGYHARPVPVFDSMYNAADGSFKKRFSALGFVADPDRNGWTVGTPAYYGDFFLPGHPQEGFSIEVNGARSDAWTIKYTQNAASGFSGTLTGNNIAYTNTGGQVKGIWQGNMGNLSVKQVTQLNAGSLYFTVFVTLKNNGASALNNIYYLRTVDPDNDASLASFSYNTNNNIAYQLPNATNKTLVAAKGIQFPNAYVGLGTKDCRAKAFFMSANFTYYPNAPLSNIYSGSAPGYTYSGNNGGNDNAMGVVFNIGTINAGDSTTLSYAYILKEQDLDSALTQTQPLFQYNGNTYASGDTIYACPGTVLPVSIINGDYFTSWSWSPSTGLNTTTGNMVNITVGNNPVTYAATSIGLCATQVLNLTVSNGLLPAPAVADVYYCQNDAPVPLTATGTNLKWYTTASGGTALPAAPTPSTATAGIYTWYVSQAMLTGCESPRAAINVFVTAKPAPPVTATVSYCQNDIATPLTATGTGLKWYTTSTGGVALPGAPTPVTAVPGIYTWYVSQSVNGCESDRAQIDVTVATKPAPPVVNTVVYFYCQFDTSPAALSAIGQNIKWRDSTTGIVSTTAPVPSTAVPGTHIWYATQTVNGCESNRVPVRVIVTAKPAPPSFTNPVVRCQNDSPTPVSVQGQGIRWYSSATGGTGVGTAPLPQTAYIDTTTYWVTQTVNGCESDRAQVDVIVYYKPNALILASKSTLCQYDTVSLRYFGNALPDAVYTWTAPAPYSTIVSGTGQGPLVVRFDSAGTYNIKLVVNNHGCLSPETFQLIKVNKTPVIKMRLKPDLCVDELLKVQLGYASAGQNTYAWDFDGATVLYSIPGVGPYDIVWHTPGLHVISVSASSGSCTAPPLRDSILVHALPDAKIRYVEKDNFCSGDSVVISAADSVGYKYTWSPAGFFNGQNTASVYSTVFYTADVILKVKDKYGCTATDSVQVHTQPCCDIYFPDAFTPNGDGRNDLFRPITIGNHRISNYRITNRWGQQMFETDDEHRGWDGRLNGVAQEMGIYFYYIRYKCYDGQYIEQKGSFTLLR